MSRLVAFGVLLMTVLVSGAAAGLWNGRWGGSGALQAAAARLDRIPLSLGTEWDVEETKLSDREIAIAEITGYISRRYVHRRTGTIVSILLLCGRSGPISVHTPEICYAGAGYVQAGSVKAYTSPTGSSAKFQVYELQKSNVATPTLLRVFLDWGHKGEWSVPANPRFAFAGKPYLYKLYVVRQMAQKDEPLKEDPATDLIKELMPQLQEKLFRDT